MSSEARHKWRRNRLYDFGAHEAGVRDRRYAQIAEKLIRDAIEHAGDGSLLLPEERELADRFGVSRSTIRNSLALLEKYALVHRRRGHGTVLTRPPEEVMQVWQLHQKRLLLFQFSPVAVRARDWYGHILTSLLAAAKVHRQTVEIRHCLTVTEVRQELQMLRECEQVAGVLLCGDVDTLFMEVCCKKGIPCVCVDYWPHDEFSDAVTVDVEAEAYLAASHLAQLGIRSVGFVAYGRHLTGKLELRWDADVWRFLAHLLQAARRYKLQMRNEWLITVSGSKPLNRRSRDPLSRIEKLPESLICFNDLIAVHVLDLLRKHGLRCPQDICLISRGARPTPKMKFTTLANSPDEIGRVALRLALERIYRWRLRPLRVGVSSRLIPGESTQARQ